ncbi:MAG TPA: ornithine cyclodeaminase family protein [Candidatus Dormibacteraeota bacterium]|nr:ornithine cyclodeaminase family protein [Candidatus Dormibacteraeota bacterium]
MLSKPDVAGLLVMNEMIAEMQAGFLAFAKGEIQQPQRLRIATSDGCGYGAFMPCYIPGEGMAVKINTNFRGNPALGLPRILGLLVLLDTSTGAPLAIMDSTAITAFRTAAASGVAMRHLSREDASTLGVLGSGTLALPHILAATSVRDIRRIRVYSPHISSRRDEFLAAAREAVGVPVDIADSAKEVVSSSDILIICTSSSEPVLDGSWIRPATCIVAVGNATPDSRELDSMVVKRSRVICDSSRACLVEAGDLLIPLNEGCISTAHVAHDLGDILLGREPAVRNADDIVLFKSVGLAFEDLVASRFVYLKAVAAGIGESFDFLRVRARALVNELGGG